MGRIQEGDIHCPALQAAFDRALAVAFGNSTYPSGVNWPGKFGNHVSSKGTLAGSDVCSSCGKTVEVQLVLAKINEATDSESGRPAKLFDEMNHQTIIKVSGTKCSRDEHQK